MGEEWRPVVNPALGDRAEVVEEALFPLGAQRLGFEGCLIPRLRGRDEAEDKRLAEELLADPKIDGVIIASSTDARRSRF